MTGNNVKIKPLTRTSSVKIDDDTCWCCNKKFNQEVKKDKQTEHHGIPKRYSPHFNVRIPICNECHDMINKEDQFYKKRYSMIRGIVLLTDKNVNSNRGKK